MKLEIYKSTYDVYRHKLDAMVYARNAYLFLRLKRKRRCLDLPAGAIYTDESRVDIDGNTFFGFNSAKGKPRRNRGVE